MHRSVLIGVGLIEGQRRVHNMEEGLHGENGRLFQTISKLVMDHHVVIRKLQTNKSGSFLNDLKT